MKRQKLKPGDIVARESKIRRGGKTLGMVMRNEEELLIAYPGQDELTIEAESELKRKGNIRDIEKIDVRED